MATTMPHADYLYFGTVKDIADPSYGNAFPNL